MSGKWKRYPAYRESGVEWLGRIPVGWEIRKLKHSARFQGGGTPSKDDPRYWNGDIPWVSPKDMKRETVADSEDHITAEAIRASATRLIPDGAVLIVVRSGILKHSIPVAINSRPVALNQDMKAIMPMSRLSSRYLAWLINGMQSSFLLQWRKAGATVESLEHELVASTPTPCPSDCEQQAIAAFLDRETAKIDALVAKKERLIELLQEKRTALISHAVTRGLNPNAPLRDSGIPWIGGIPAHWKLKRFRHVTTRVDVGIAEAATHAYADEGVPILRSTNVRANRLLLDDILRVQPWFAEKNRSKYLLKDDILTVRTGNAGVSVVVPEKLHRSQCFTMLMSTLRKHQDARFYCYFLNASSGQTVFAIEAWGTAQANISVPILKEVPVVEPPYEEQTAIVALIEYEAAKLDALMAKVRTAIDRLQEYRTALISAAVTGQIDVREEARP